MRWPAEWILSLWKCSGHTCAVIPLLQGEGSGTGKGLKKGEKDSEGEAVVFHAEVEEYFSLERSKIMEKRSKIMGEKSKIMWEMGGIWWNWALRAMAKVKLCAFTAWEAGGNKIHSQKRGWMKCSSRCCRMLWTWEISVDSGGNEHIPGKETQGGPMLTSDLRNP